MDSTSASCRVGSSGSGDVPRAGGSGRGGVPGASGSGSANSWMEADLVGAGPLPAGVAITSSGWRRDATPLPGPSVHSAPAMQSRELALHAAASSLPYFRLCPTSGPGFEAIVAFLGEVYGESPPVEAVRYCVQMWPEFKIILRTFPLARHARQVPFVAIRKYLEDLAVALKTARHAQRLASLRGFVESGSVFYGEVVTPGAIERICRRYPGVSFTSSSQIASMERRTRSERFDWFCDQVRVAKTSIQFQSRDPALRTWTLDDAREALWCATEIVAQHRQAFVFELARLSAGEGDATHPDMLDRIAVIGRVDVDVLRGYLPENDDVAGTELGWLLAPDIPTSRLHALVAITYPGSEVWEAHAARSSSRGAFSIEEWLRQPALDDCTLAAMSAQGGEALAGAPSGSSAAAAMSDVDWFDALVDGRWYVGQAGVGTVRVAELREDMSKMPQVWLPDWAADHHSCLEGWWMAPGAIASPRLAAFGNLLRDRNPEAPACVLPIDEWLRDNEITLVRLEAGFRLLRLAETPDAEWMDAFMKAEHDDDVVSALVERISNGYRRPLESVGELFETLDSAASRRGRT